jgi:hypothetical protein
MKRDLGKYTRQTNIQLIAGGLLVLFIIGDGLILVIYGPQSAIFGLLCIGVGLIPVLLIYLVFVLIDWILKNARKED